MRILRGYYYSFPVWIQRRITVRFISNSSSITNNSFQSRIKEANSRCKDTVELRNMDERGWGVYARRDFTKGETVIRSRALQIHPTSGTHTIQTGWNTHVTMDLPAILLNHSCSPNLSIQVNNDGAYDFVAILPIQANEEVHFDYETCEYDFKMKCLCGSNNCKGELKGYKYHGPSILQAHGTNGVSPYLLSKSNHAFNSIIS